MTDIALNLIVIRSSDLARAERFYGLLGMKFTRERHDSGPEHLACRVGSIVLEIYPSDGASPTAAVRLGVQVLSVLAVITKLNEAGANIVTPPKDGPWGLRAVVVDPDGHRIEITQFKEQPHEPEELAKETHPWKSLAGILKDHPDMDEFEENIREYRRQVDADPNR